MRYITCLGLAWVLLSWKILLKITLSPFPWYPMCEPLCPKRTYTHLCMCTRTHTQTSTMTFDTWPHWHLGYHFSLALLFCSPTVQAPSRVSQYLTADLIMPALPTSSLSLSLSLWISLSPLLTLSHSVSSFLSHSFFLPRSLCLSLFLSTLSPLPLPEQEDNLFGNFLHF